MDWDDVIYLTLLFSSIGIGYFYRQITDPEKKKISGTAIGFIIALIVSGIHILHLIGCILVNAIIILFMPRRYCHVASFIFSFTHLIFFRSTIYFGIPYPPSHTNLVQMMLTLKLVGLAFELNHANRLTQTKSDDKQKQLSQEQIEYTQLEPSFADIWHYSFNYVGVLTGPYYKYRTFYDFIYTPYSRLADCNMATFNKLKWIPLFMILFLIVTKIWPLSYALTDEFYEQRSWLYRWWYATPTFFWFRMRIYTGLTLSECVCTMAGMGAYPTVTETKSGEGPTKQLILVKHSIESGKIKERDYDFNTIHNINAYGSDFCMTFREGMKHWNMCIQYWLAVNIYKRFPIKPLRVFATTLVSAAWHGVYLGYYYCIVSVPFCLAVEDVYMKIFKDKSGPIKYFIFWFVKMQAFSYFGFAFHLLSVEKVFKYYNSVYHCFEVLLAVLYLIGMFVLKSQKSKKVFESDKQKIHTKIN